MATAPRVLCALSVTVITFTQPAAKSAARAGSVRGQVVHALSGEPLRKVALAIRPLDRKPGSAFQEIQAPLTGPDGKFAIDNLEPGWYEISGVRLGFAPLLYGGRRSGMAMPVEIKAGETLNNIRLKLMPQSVISGILRDEDGDPIEGAEVVALRASFHNDEQTLQSAGQGRTDDLGRFRIASLGPGRYYVAAIPFRHRTEHDYIATIFFPGVFDWANASALILRPGESIDGLNMTWRRTSAVRLSGRVINRPPDEDSDLHVYLDPRDVAGVFRGSGGRPRWEGDRFVIDDVPPGLYLLSATQLRVSGVGVQRIVEVGDRDIDDLILDMSEGARVEGRIRWQHPASNPDSSQVFVRNVARPEFSGDTQVSSDGTFRFSGLAPGPYRVHVSGLSPGTYLQSAKLGDVNVLEDGWYPERGGTLELTISAGAAEVVGSVVDDAGQPVAGATVVLAPQRDSRFRHLIRFTVAGPGGRFRLTDLVPGEYRVFAWEELEAGAWYDPEVLRAAQPTAKSIILKQNSKETVELLAIRAN